MRSACGACGLRLSAREITRVMADGNPVAAMPADSGRLRFAAEIPSARR
jgi:predicted  nucleic acid-binding Zn-ribbon protein